MTEAGFRVEVVKPKLTEMLLRTAHGPAFPFIQIQFKKRAAPVKTLKLNVEKNLLEIIKKHYGSDKVILYLELTTGRIEAWTRDMLMSFRILQKLGIMNPPEVWINNARHYMRAFLTDEEMSPLKPTSKNEIALKHTIAILKAARLLQEVKEKQFLLTIASDVIRSGKKDADSIIYRLAMAIYHSKRLADQPAIEGIEDPGSAYLALREDKEFTEKYAFILDEFEKIPPPLRPESVKTFLCFVIGAYLFNRAILDMR